MILLDTNVLSELMRPAPEKAVEQRLADQPDASVFISTITEAELRYGVALLPAGKRRSALVGVIEDMLVFWLVQKVQEGRRIHACLPRCH